MLETDNEHYVAKVEECRAKAAEATDPNDKASWLALAKDWEAMVENTRRRQKRGI
jgi:hypothetical protein